MNCKISHSITRSSSVPLSRFLKKGASNALITSTNSSFGSYTYKSTSLVVSLITGMTDSCLLLFLVIRTMINLMETDNDFK